MTTHVLPWRHHETGVAQPASLDGRVIVGTDAQWRNLFPSKAPEPRPERLGATMTVEEWAAECGFSLGDPDAPVVVVGAGR